MTTAKEKLQCAREALAYLKENQRDIADKIEDAKKRMDSAHVEYVEEVRQEAMAIGLIISSAVIIQEQPPPAPDPVEAQKLVLPPEGEVVLVAAPAAPPTPRERRKPRKVPPMVPSLAPGPPLLAGQKFISAVTAVIALIQTAGKFINAADIEDQLRQLGFDAKAAEYARLHAYRMRVITMCHQGWYGPFFDADGKPVPKPWKNRAHTLEQGEYLARGVLEALTLLFETGSGHEYIDADILDKATASVIHPDWVADQRDVAKKARNYAHLYFDWIWPKDGKKGGSVMITPLGKSVQKAKPFTEYESFPRSPKP